MNNIIFNQAARTKNKTAEVIIKLPPKISIFIANTYEQADQEQRTQRAHGLKPSSPAMIMVKTAMALTSRLPKKGLDSFNAGISILLFAGFLYSKTFDRLHPISEHLSIASKICFPVVSSFKYPKWLIADNCKRHALTFHPNSLLS